jgi:hypothetical protein
MRRSSFVLLALLLMAAGAAAQQPPPPPRLQRAAPSPPPLPPPPAALSVPDPLAAFRPGLRDLYRSPDGSDRFRHGSQYPVRPPHPAQPIYFPGGYFPTSPYYVDPYFYEDSARWYWKHAFRGHEVALRGALVLGTLPGEAEVYVDGYYAGLAEEFGWSGRPMDIAAGAHRIEARATGYDTLSFSVMIEPGQILRYRGEMTRVSSPKPTVVVVAPQQAVAQSIYIIPNCYAGNKPPSRTLPKGCERKNLQTRK